VERLKAIKKLCCTRAGNKNLHMSTKTTAEIALENNLFIAAAHSECHQSRKGE